MASQRRVVVCDQGARFHNYPDENALPGQHHLQRAGGPGRDDVVDPDRETTSRSTRTAVRNHREPEPADRRPNHLQLTSGSTIIAARNTLADWNAEEADGVVDRAGRGPPNSLFGQLGGFAFLGGQVTDNPLLTTLVSLVPPLPYMPP